MGYPSPLDVRVGLDCTEADKGAIRVYLYTDWSHTHPIIKSAKKRRKFLEKSYTNKNKYDFLTHVYTRIIANNPLVRDM